jgi:uncharacterized membrane protein (DUF2068 family)
VTTTKKPLGITATAVYYALSGIIYLPIGLILLFANALPKDGSIFVLGGSLLMVLGVFMLVSVYGLWSLQEWGRKLTKWLSVAAVMFGIVAIFPIMPKQEFTISHTIFQLVGIGIALLIIVYLSKPHIKALFEAQ